MSEHELDKVSSELKKAVVDTFEGDKVDLLYPEHPDERVNDEEVDLF